MNTSHQEFTSLEIFFTEDKAMKYGESNSIKIQKSWTEAKLGELNQEVKVAIFPLLYEDLCSKQFIEEKFEKRAKEIRMIKRLENPLKGGRKNFD